MTPGTYDHVGQELTYSYVVTNTGNVTMTEPVTVTDDRATVTCETNLPFAPLESLICSATYTVTQADLDAGSVINTASATSGTTTSPVDSATAIADQAPALQLAKVADPTSVSAVGQDVLYTYTVTNDLERHPRRGVHWSTTRRRR